MAHVINDADYFLIRDLSFGYSKRRNLPYSWREDAAHFAVLKAYRVAEYHDDMISPFSAALIFYVWRWTMQFFMWTAGHAWRKDAYRNRVVFCDPENLPDRAYEPDPSQRLDDKEMLKQQEEYLSERTERQRVILLFTQAGFDQVEIAEKLGITKQAVNDQLMRLQRNFVRAS